MATIAGTAQTLAGETPGASMVPVGWGRRTVEEALGASKLVGLCEPSRGGGRRAALDTFAARDLTAWERHLPLRETREVPRSRELLRRWFEPVLPPGALPWSFGVSGVVIGEALGAAEKGCGLLLEGVERCAAPPKVEEWSPWARPDDFGERERERVREGVEALDFVVHWLGVQIDGWSRLQVVFQLNLPGPWARALLDHHSLAPALPLVELGPLSPEDLQQKADEVQLPWSADERMAFGAETGFSHAISAAVLGMAARYRWSLRRALLYATEADGPLDDVLHPTWVEMRRDPGLRALLDELDLPAEGPGRPIDPGPVGAPRWQRLQVLFSRHLIRHTGEGFLGPCPLLRRWLR